MLNVLEGYPYVYETHLHTKEGSACGTASAVEMVQACKSAGYTGIIVTNHFFYGNTAVDRTLPWNEWVEGYCKGYELAKERGDSVGLQVFLGWESTYDGTDFLVYGLDKEWLLKHPEIKDATIEEQYHIVHQDGGIIIHAHPFREASYIPEIRLFPKYVDGVETVNATHVQFHAAKDGSVPYDLKAKQYAGQYQFPQTAGSDIHGTNILGGGMAFSEKLTSIQDFIKAVMNKKGRLLP